MLSGSRLALAGTYVGVFSAGRRWPGAPSLEVAGTDMASLTVRKLYLCNICLHGMALYTYLILVAGAFHTFSLEDAAFPVAKRLT